MARKKTGRTAHPTGKAGVTGGGSKRAKGGKCK